ncbi:extracellular solute-binding protein [Actinopolymorpha sp. B11F2]|uniref:extracellular solute-binding protein n=1 Tax=Actinopolymorpha sp. B11F2 TaxID=3160862 RepID=UPI0032E3B2F7
MSDTRSSVLSRRLLLQAGAAGTAPLVVPGCSGSSGSSGVKAGKGAIELPKHLPAPAVPGEIKAKHAGLPNAYARVPQPLRKAWPNKPGDGGSMSMFTIIWGPPAPPPEKNPFWQRLNDKLGLELKMIWGPSDSYESKLATLLASGNLPDVTALLPNPTSDKALRQGAFADLSEFLSGDKMKSYPNLSNNTPEQAWKVTLIDGRVMGVTNPVPAVDTVFPYRGDWAAKIGFTKPPANASELKEFFTAIPKAIGTVNGHTPYGIGAFPGPVMGLVNAMFRAGPEWREDGGTLVNRLDTPEYEAAIAWCREVWAGGGFHPDALALDAQEIKAIGMFESGLLGIMKSGLMYPFTVSSPLYGIRQKNPGIVPLLPPGHDGGKAAWVKTTGWFSRWGISAKSAKNPSRVEAILRCLDFLNASFGTEEYMFNRFGIEGRHYNYNAKGEPIPVDDGNLQSELAGLGQYPHGYYFPGNPNGHKEALAYAESMMDGAVDDPIASLSSSVADRVGGVLEKVTTDYVNQIVTGRRPMSDLATCRAEWHKRGGDQLKADLEKQLSIR